MSLNLIDIYTKSGKRIKLDNVEAYNLGCGEQRYEGVKGVDISQTSGADLVFDLNDKRWPIPDSSVDLVFAFHVLEHLRDLNDVMSEIYRILKPGGNLIAEVPYYRHRGAFQDPTHIHFFTGDTFNYFASSKKRVTARYSSFNFEIKEFFYGWPATGPKGFLKKLLQKYRGAYDQYLSLLFPVPILVVRLQAKK